MSVVSLLAQIALFSTASVAQAVAQTAASPDFAELWSQFKRAYSKDYEASGMDSESHRFTIFKSNVQKIREHNAKNLSYSLGVNQFTDLTAEEFSATYLGYRSDWKQLRDFPAEPFPSYDPTTLDDAVDWVSKGAVTPVKNQQRCGSCWAFSTTGSVEGAFFVASGQLLSLSEEELVQCDKKDHGCEGGLPDYGFAYVKKNGISAETDYPYTSGDGKTGQCDTQKCHPVVRISGFVDVPHGNEDALKAAVSTQPVSVAIEADKKVFQFYKAGVFDSIRCGKKLDHAVLVVGYGTDTGKDYWIVKNSWSESWGESGYMRMIRGKNMCGIAQQASYPTGASPAGPAPGPSPPPGPAPPPGPTPPPGPSPPPASPHYEDPKDGCRSDEKDVHVQGLSGSFCSPLCHKSTCPEDVPEGVTAKPQCLLQGPGGEKRCALQCSKGQCGTAVCHKIASIGICTYGGKVSGNVSLVEVASAEESIVV